VHGIGIHSNLFVTLIKTADHTAKQPEDFDLYVIKAFNEVMRLTLYRHADTVDAFQQLEDPT